MLGGDPLTMSNNIFQLITALLIGSFTIYHFTDKRIQIRTQTEYETAFKMRYQNEINRMQSEDVRHDNFIPLTFGDREIHRMLELCRESRPRWTPKQSIHRWKFKSFDQSVEVHYIGFRRIKAKIKPVRIQVILCNDKYALIENGDGQSGYVLEAVERSQVLNYKLFNIYTKFLYKTQPTPQTTIRDPNPAEMTSIDLSGHNPPPRASPSPGTSNSSDADFIAPGNRRGSYVRMNRP